MDPDGVAAQVVVVGEVVDEQPKPWGFWATAGLSLAVMGTLVFMQSVTAVGFIVLAGTGGQVGPSKEFIAHLTSNGLLLSLATWFSLPFTLGLTVLFVRIRGSWSLRDYLALRFPPAKTTAVWLGIVFVFVVAYDAAATLVGSGMSDFTIRIYETAGYVPLLWLTLAVAAPVFEEIFFRGFMFRGIQGSHLGAAGAIVITSLTWRSSTFSTMPPCWRTFLCWASSLGIARARSGSVYLTMAMHALVNLMSLVQMQMYLAG